MPRLTLQRLLGGGYFPEVLPPPFTTESFGAAFAASKTPPVEFENHPGGSSLVPRRSKCVRYHQAAAGGAVRTFSIPNPVHFYRLAACFFQNRAVIMRLARSSPLSITKPHVAIAGRQCFIPSVGFRDRPFARARIRASARFILRTDIARFFPSIYTHSIAWAFHGKTVAKQQRRNQTLVGNQLDQHFQNLQDGQTAGIPIGQDISRVVAEVILGRIEKSLDYDPFPIGIRAIDDYEIGFLSQSKAEKFRSRLERGLAEYELALNPLKTSILPLPQLLVDRWDSDLRRFDFGQGPLEVEPADEDQVNPLSNADLPDDLRVPPDTNKLLTFMNTAIALQREHPHEGVLRFALVRLSHLRMTAESWSLLQDFLFQCALNQPETLRLVVSILLRARFLDEQEVDHGRLTGVLNAILESSAAYTSSSSTTWALWIALLFRCKVSVTAAAHVSQTTDAVTACLACEINARSLWPKRFDLPRIRHEIASPGALYGEHWLIAYEAARNGWLRRTPQSLSADPCFSYLLQEDVAYFAPKTDKDLKRHLRAALKAKKSPSADEDSEDGSGADDLFDLWWLRDDSD